jgi:hypothetical protein
LTPVSPYATVLGGGPSPLHFSQQQQQAHNNNTNNMNASLLQQKLMLQQLQQSVWSLKKTKIKSI